MKNETKKETILREVLSIIASGIIFLVILSIQDAARSVDEKFMRSLHDELCNEQIIMEEYNQISDKDFNTWIQYQYKYIDLQLDRIKDYKEMEFEDKELGYKANEYIDILAEMRKDISKFDDKYKAKNPNLKFYINDYLIEDSRRSGVIIDLSNIYGDKFRINKESFEFKYKKYLDLEKFIKEIKTCNFEKVKVDGDKVSYTTTIKNTTDTTFNLLEIKVIPMDKEGNIFEVYGRKDGKAYNEEIFKPGEEIYLDFTIEGELDKFDILVYVD